MVATNSGNANSLAMADWNNLRPIADEVPGVTVYDIDMFATSAATLAALHAQGDIVIAYIDFGTAEDWRPDYSEFPGTDLGDNNG
jgi:hypothetical protein